MPNNRENDATARKNDNNESLQNELGREAKEGSDSIGDVSSNRTVSGSSTWETLPDEQAGSGDKSTSKDETRRKK